VNGSDTIRLEVTASADTVPVVRMILGGVAARVGLSLEELEDVGLAVEELFAAVARSGDGPRCGLVIAVGDDGLKVTAGPFHTKALRDAVETPSAPGTFTTRLVMDTVVQAFAVCEAGDDCFAVEFSKRHEAG
jgi:hypothetical protein